MIWLKCCQRCGGDLYLEKDDFGAFVACFQCGAYEAQFDAEVEEGSVAEAMEDVIARRLSA